MATGPGESLSPVTVGLADFVRAVVCDAEPLSQNTRPDDLGFGWLYHGIVRNLRPDYVAGKRLKSAAVHLFAGHWHH